MSLPEFPLLLLKNDLLLKLVLDLLSFYRIISSDLFNLSSLFKEWIFVIKDVSWLIFEVPLRSLTMKMVSPSSWAISSRISIILVFVSVVPVISMIFVISAVSVVPILSLWILSVPTLFVMFGATAAVWISNLVTRLIIYIKNFVNLKQNIRGWTLTFHRDVFFSFFVLVDWSPSVGSR